MKISTLLKVATLAAIPIVVTSCGGKATDKSSDTTDSIIKNQTEEGAFCSPDLAMENLKGQVKSVTETTYNIDETGELVDPDEAPEVEITNFSPEGMILNYHNIDFAKDTKLATQLIHRNDKGQLERYTCGQTDIIGTKYDEVEVFGQDEYTYDNLGRKTKLTYTGYEWTGETTFEYDEKGDLTLMENHYSDSGESGQRNTRFNIEKKDDHGNWIEAGVSVETIWSEEEDDPDNVNREIYATKVVRKIEYYK